MFTFWANIDISWQIVHHGQTRTQPSTKKKGSRGRGKEQRKNEYLWSDGVYIQAYSSLTRCYYIVTPQEDTFSHPKFPTSKSWSKIETLQLVHTHRVNSRGWPLWTQFGFICLFNTISLNWFTPFSFTILSMTKSNVHGLRIMYKSSNHYNTIKT